MGLLVKRRSAGTRVPAGIATSPTSGASPGSADTAPAPGALVTHTQPEGVPGALQPTPTVCWSCVVKEPGGRSPDRSWRVAGCPGIRLGQLSNLDVDVSEVAVDTEIGLAVDDHGVAEFVVPAEQRWTDLQAARC